MVTMSFRTKAPFVVTTLGGEIKSYHWHERSAIEAAKESGERLVHERYRGIWKPILHYIKGVKQ
jgi:hypothetical protein